MFFMKLRTSVAVDFSMLFGSSTLAGSFMQQCLEMFNDAGPCQKALFLLCAARSMPTSPFLGDCKLAAPLLSPLLQDPSWQLRACAIQCLQRLMSGCIGTEATAHSISALLRDPEPSVRLLAATAVGCLGSKAVRYKGALCILLKDSCNHVRYASLITIGGCMAKGRPLTETLARHLNDKDPKCRMAALRALECMGCTAQGFIAELKAWQGQWYAQVPHGSSHKLEPITTRALMFPHILLKHIFKGHAPLGERFGGSKSFREARKQEYDLQVCKEQRLVMLYGADHYLREATCKELDLQIVDAKEAHERYREVQQKYSAIEGRRHRQKLDKSAQWRLAGCERSKSRLIWDKNMSRPQNRMKWSDPNQSAELMEAWVIPILTPH